MTDSETIVVQREIKRNRRIKVSSSVVGDRRKVAAVRFSGEYLHHIGIKPGMYVNLKINDDNSITITPIEDEEARSITE